MAKTSLYGTIGTSNNNLVDGQQYATTLNAVSGKTVKDLTGNVVASVTGNLTFNTTGQSDAVQLAFGKATGNYQGTLNLAGAKSPIENGEAKTVLGVTVLPENVSYNVDVLSQRKVTLSGGTATAVGLLSGASLPAISLSSTSDDLHTTRVNVAGATVTSGGLTFTLPSTYINAAGSINVPVTVTGFGAAAVTTTGVNSLAVTSAEVASVGDTATYTSLSGKYKYSVTDVGIAQGVTSNSTFGGALTASIGPNATLAIYSTNSSNCVPLSSMVNPSAQYGVVGSEADILNSTLTGAGGATPTMSWRTRTSTEANGPGVLLTSDVVQISGVSGIDYVLQMSYTGQTGTEPIDTFSNGAWATPTGPYEGLSYASYQATLASGTLPTVGTWGVDPTTHQTWEVVSGNGTFAVDPPSAVPEPSTLVLLGIGAIGLLARAWRRRKQIIA